VTSGRVMLRSTNQSTSYPDESGIDFGDHQVGVAREQLRHDLHVAEIDVAVLVRRRYRHDVDIEVFHRRRQVALAIVGDRGEVGAALGVDLAVVGGDVVRCEPEAFAQARQVPIECGGAVVDVDVFRLHQASREGGAHQVRRRLRDGEADAVAGFDMGGGFVRLNQTSAQLRAPVGGAVNPRCRSHY
jgi:hypothetical protein